MNKILVISILNAYSVINDGCLSIVTYEHTYNDCHINDIVSIQFADKAALVGMK